MTTSSSTINRPQFEYTSHADRLVDHIAASLVSRTEKRAERTSVSRERRALLIEREAALFETEYRAACLRALR
jgi:hypothetical protein